MKIVLALQLVFVLVMGTGWVKNVIKLANCDFEPSYRAEVIHAVGLFPLVGMVTGWLDVGK